MEQIVNGLKCDTEKARISRSRWEADLAWQEKNPGGRRIAFWHPKRDTVELVRHSGAGELLHRVWVPGHLRGGPGADR